MKRTMPSSLHSTKCTQRDHIGTVNACEVVAEIYTEDEFPIGAFNAFHRRITDVTGDGERSICNDMTEHECGICDTDDSDEYTANETVAHIVMGSAGPNVCVDCMKAHPDSLLKALTPETRKWCIKYMELLNVLTEP